MEGFSEENTAHLGRHIVEKGVDKPRSRISHVLQTLADSVKELKSVEEMLEGEDPVDLGLLDVASSMHGKMEKFMADVLAVPGIQDHLESTVQGLIPNKNHQISAVDSRCKGKRKAAVEGEAICDHVSSKHTEVANLNLWRNLPEDLVGLVFSHSVARDITALQLISKGWSSAQSTTAWFQNLCQQASGNMFALIKWDYNAQRVTLHMLDGNSNKWRPSVRNKFECSIPSSIVGRYHRNLTIAHGGGLVCFVPGYDPDEGVWPIVVYNPLTGVWKELPMRSLHGEKIVMTQLVTDQDRKFYKLFTVCSVQESVFQAKCYDSRTGTWSKMHQGFICAPSLPQIVHGLYTFDCAQGRMTYLPLPLHSEHVGSAAFQDRVFAMRKKQEAGHNISTNETSREVDRDSDRNSCASELYEIVEFQVDTGRSEVKEIKSYGCPRYAKPFQEYDLSIFVCSNSIMIIAGITVDRCFHELIAICDMSKAVWRHLPQLRVDDFPLSNNEGRICELRWDAIP